MIFHSEGHMIKCRIQLSNYETFACALAHVMEKCFMSCNSTARPKKYPSMLGGGQSIFVMQLGGQERTVL